MASRLKRNQEAVMVSTSEPHGLPSGMFSLYPPQSSSTHDARKKRKNQQSSWVNRTYTPYFDGHLWRKYGQKAIKDAPYPRLYFRCSYREDRHCMASKQLQQVNSEDPPLFEVTYMHEHTCNADPIPAPDVRDATGPPSVARDGFVLSFGSSSSGSRGHHHRDALMQQKRQHFHQCQPAVHQSSKMTLGSRNSQLHEKEKPAFLSSHLSPTGPSGTSSSLPSIDSSSSASSSTSNTEDGLFLTVDWDTFSGLIDQFDDREQFLGSTFPLESDGFSFTSFGVGTEAAAMFQF